MLDHDLPLVREARRFLQALQRPEDLVATFRAASVYIECVTDPPTIPVTRVDGLPWLAVFSSLQRMAHYFRERGEGARSIEYLTLSGARLTDVYLSGMPKGTSMLLDPLAEHAVTLPSVPGIVPDSVAVANPAPTPSVDRLLPTVSPYAGPVRKSWEGAL